MLISFSGIPASGKTTIARELAKRVSAFHVEIDSIEQAIRLSGPTLPDTYPLAYRIGFALAQDNLRLGHHVIVDCVNGVSGWRDKWRDLAKTEGAALCEVEVVCSDAAIHRARFAGRSDDREQRWVEATEHYQKWQRDH